MAISMGQSDELRGSTVDALSGGVDPNTSTPGNNWLEKGGNFLRGVSETTGASLAGVTETFATNFSKAVTEYVTTVQGKINSIIEFSASSAIYGTMFNEYFGNFRNKVAELANEYVGKLTSVENDIVDSVAKAYAEQDADLSTDVNSDKGVVEQAKLSSTSDK